PEACEAVRVAAWGGWAQSPELALGVDRAFPHGPRLEPRDCVGAIDLHHYDRTERFLCRSRPRLRCGELIRRERAALAHGGIESRNDGPGQTHQQRDQMTPVQVLDPCGTGYAGHCSCR